MIPLYSRRSWLLALISPIEVIASRSQQPLRSGIIAGAERSVLSVRSQGNPSTACTDCHALRRPHSDFIVGCGGL